MIISLELDNTREETESICLYNLYKKVNLYMKLAGNYNIIRQGLGIIFILIFSK
jgi:hypothetical protein